MALRPERKADTKPRHARKPLLAALNGQACAVPPVWLMRQAGRYLPEYREIRNRAGGFLELCFTPGLAAEVTLQPVRRFGLDAAILFSDILVVPYALGQDLHFTEGEGPALEAITEASALAYLSPTRFHERLAPVYETVTRVSEALRGSDVALIGFAGAPWTVATYMVEGGTSRDFARTKAWAYGRPAEFQRLIDLVVQVTAAYLVRQIEAGAEAIQIFDSWASALSESEFNRWSIEPIREIVARVRESYPDVPIIGFPRAVGLGYRRFVERTKCQAVSLDPSVPLDWAARELQSLCAVQGNLDPMLLVIGGEPLRQETLRIVEAWREGPFVFNLGHGIVQATPPEHVAALVSILRETSD